MRDDTIIIHESEYIRLYFDLKDKQIKILGGQLDKAAQDYVNKMSFVIYSEIKEILKDPVLVEGLLSEMSNDELTNTLLRYRLLIEKKLFGRT